MRPSPAAILAGPGLLNMATEAATDVAQLYPRVFRAARAALLAFADGNPGVAGERRLTMLLGLGASPKDPCVREDFVFIFLCYIFNYDGRFDVHTLVEALPTRLPGRVIVQVRREPPEHKSVAT